MPSIVDQLKAIRAAIRSHRDQIGDARCWLDDDLAALSEDGLVRELLHTQQAVRVHRDIVGRERTLENDRALYLVLPERLTADFRLPSEAEFLGEAKAPTAGCPSFWRSHQSCKSETHDVHAWGPCAS